MGWGRGDEAEEMGVQARQGFLLETKGQPALEEGISAAVSRESEGPRRLSWFALIR